MNEFVIEKDTITIEDLEQIYRTMKPNEDCVINFPESPGEKQDFTALKPYFDKIITNSKHVVLIADPPFEKLISGHSIAKVQFIDKPAFCYSKVQGVHFDEVFVSLIEKFWEHYFPQIKQIDRSQLPIDRTTFNAKAAVTLIRTHIPYTLVMRMDSESLKMATEKILQISLQDFSYAQGSMVAEILNIICGHLKPVLRKKNFEVNIQIGIPEEISHSEKPHELPDIFNWIFELGPQAQFEVSFYKEL